MRRITPHVRRRIIRWGIAAPFLWLGLALALALVSSILVGLVLASADNRSTSSSLDSSATSLHRIHPIARLAASAPMLGTLHACEVLGKWLLPISGPCLAADLGATGSVALTEGGSAYHQLTAGGLIADRTLNIAGLRDFAARSSDIDTRLRSMDDAITKATDWGVLWFGLDAKARKLDDLLWRADAAVLATPSLIDLLDSPNPARFFVGLTSQAETRAGGGLLGMYAIVSITHGHIAIEQLGSNLDLPKLSAVPAGLNAGFYDLFGTGNPEWQNLNLAPDGPTAGSAWVNAWRNATGQRLDGAISIDTLTLGRLCAATGIALQEAGGRVLSTADEIADYASFGVYTEFPNDDLKRKEYQANIFAQAVDRLLGSTNDPTALVKSLMQSISDGHAWAYLDRPMLEQMLKSSEIAGWTGQLGSRSVQVRFNNLSGNKADFFLRAKPQSVTSVAGSSVRLTLSLDKALKRVQAPIVRNRLDGFAATGLGTYMQVMFSVGSDLQVRGARVNGMAVKIRRVDYDGTTVVALPVNVVLGRTAVVELLLDGEASITDALAGALVHS